jgi:Zn-dependent M28 family amino/carboxypeptidase
MIRTHSRRPRLVALGAAGALALAGTVAVAAPAAAAPGTTPVCEKRTNNTVAKLTDCVTLDGVMEHLEAFQGIADANGGNRASGTPGYTPSADYVVGRLEAAGWEVERQPFEFPFFELLSSSFSRVAPAPQPYQTPADYIPMTYSATGTVDDGAVVPVDLGGLVATETSTSGCEASDFAGFPSGGVALVQRGTCNFGVKVENAAVAGASAVIVVNRGTPENEGPVAGTLGAPGRIPAVGASFAVGQGLLAQGTTVDLDVQAVSEFRTTENVIAELPGRTSDNVVMAGAHLDSVPAGPGINDNGSGSAALVEIAENLRKAELTNTVRFAWWGAEELGLQGSNHYVAQLDQAQREDLALYLNFDMIGSPNFARFIYDGDLSAFPAPAGVPVPAGSDQIEYVFEDFYEEQELPYEGTEFSGRSDYQAFILAGIPSGGLFTGAEGIKQDYQAAAYGGQAGIAYDPNYHQAGDGITNLDPEALDQNSDAVAYAVLTLAYDTQRVNGVAGEPVPGGTFEGDPAAREYRIDPQQPNGGGGHDHDHGGDTV